MTDGYQVVTGAVRKEAVKWDGLADAAAPVHTAVQNANLALSAFFVGDPQVMLLPNLNSAVHHAYYQGFVAFMEKLLAGAQTEFSQIADVLIKTATMYEQAEKIFEPQHREELWTE